MAITIKSIPTLKSKEAQRFVSNADRAVKQRATVDFSAQVKSANSILRKAKML